MITKEFLVSIGFEEAGETHLPDWYNIFEETPTVTTAESFDYCNDEYAFTIYLSPKGPIGEYCENSEYHEGLSYCRLVTEEDVIDEVEGLFDVEIKSKIPVHNRP